MRKAGSETVEQSCAPSPDERPCFTVIGAGVIGLLTANTLAEEGYSVTVVSQEGKPDIHTHSTSAMAFGLFLPWVPEERAQAMLGDMPLGKAVELSRLFYAKLAESQRQTGVMPIRQVELISSSNPWPSGLAEAMSAEQAMLVKPVEIIDANGEETVYDTAVYFDTFSINTRRAVAYLAELATLRGVKFEQRHITLADLDGLDGIVINAAGMGAHELDPTHNVIAFKGHSFVLRPQPGQQMPAEGLSVDDLVILPRQDGSVICGGLRQENPERPVPEQEEAVELFHRLGSLLSKTQGMVEGLEPDFLTTADVLVHSAGYRIETEGGRIRVEPDSSNNQRLHAYGFGGIAWCVGPHFAKKIASMAQGMHLKHKESTLE